MNVRLPSPSTQPTEIAGHRANGAWFGITEAAEVTGKSRSTIKKYLADGKFPQARRDRLHGQEAWVIPLGDLLAAGLRPNAPKGGDAAAKLADQPSSDGTQGARLAELAAELAKQRQRAELAEARAQAAERLIHQQAEHVDDLRRALRMLGGGSEHAEPPPEPTQAQPPRRAERRPRRWPWQR